MSRRRRSPPQRHSSLPPSLHRLLVSGPQEDVGEDDADDTEQQMGDEGMGIPFGGVPDPVHPAPASDPHLPSLTLTQAAFAGLGVVEPATSRRQSRSPILHAAPESSATPAIPIPAISLPPFRPQRVVPTDPVYYASTSSLGPALTPSPPGPHLRPISWSPESAFSPPPGAARFGSPDRSAPPLPRTRRQPSPMASQGPIAAASSSLPVAGPSRLPDSPPPPPSGRKSRGKGKQVRTSTTLLPRRAFSTGGNPYGAHQRREPGRAEHDFGSSAQAPPAGFAAERSEATQRTVRPESARQQEAGPSSRRIPESERGSPASLTAENYPVAVGSTAYSVTTLSPLRATILPPVVDPAGAREGPSHESASSGVAAGPSARQEGAPGGGEEAEVKRSESDTESEVAGVGEKRARRARSEQEESTTSSSSEHALAPKSKKTLIACHFCRARKLRCDGQRPSCANCRKRGHPCTYEQQPKRRGPGKTPRATTRKRTRHAGAGAGGDAAPAAEPTRLAEGQGRGQGSSGSGSGGGGASSAGAGAGAASEAGAAGAPGPEAAGPSNAEGAPASAASSAAAAAQLHAQAQAAHGQAGPSPMTRPAFEPQLTGPIPTYPGFAYRPPSASSSHSGAGHLPPFHFYSLGRGMTRSVASDSVRSSNTSNVSSAPSVPDSEEGADESVADEVMDYTELLEFYRHPQPRPGPGEDGSQ